MLSKSLNFLLPWIQAFATSSRIDLAPFCVGGGEDSWLSVLQFLWQLDIPWARLVIEGPKNCKWNKKGDIVIKELNGTQNK